MLQSMGSQRVGHNLVTEQLQPAFKETKCYTQESITVSDVFLPRVYTQEAMHGKNAIAYAQQDRLEEEWQELYER